MVFDIIITIILIGIGAYTGFLEGKRNITWIIGGGLLGLLGGALLHLIRIKTKKINGQRAFTSLLGIFLGFLMGYIIYLLISPFLNLSPMASNLVKIAFLILGGYGTGLIFYYKSYEIRLLSGIEYLKPKKPEEVESYKILDTSVIIDGRIADIAETGFLEGILIVPRFVLNELQQIADSPDQLKRQRGRRGLDILNKMKKGVKTIVQIVDDDFPEIKEVDQKLIELAKKMGAKIITNDYNLNKVSQIHGVDVLNINELANAVRPIVLRGEKLTVQIIKEGKDPDQGIGYLEDGTMVVVENGLQYLGKKIDVEVTRVLQTTAGRMIFAK